MRIFRWQLLFLAMDSYILAAAVGYYLLLEPRPVPLIAVEIALGSLLGIGPRPLIVDQLSTAALTFDIAALMLGFLLRLTAVAMVVATFFGRSQTKRRLLVEQKWNSLELFLKRSRN